ncbi:ribosomal RNA small subunit methyltransferase B [Cerasicoccus arenae]|uniref:Ribosomal RNA small subunit methyltransferase B n=2 Tax=Cerasicoccus arenae TaxID=424488 RepID=A0A8J3GF21_9BACT|nr:ribosomal RNA small subunit methyltransferase B [Cerasicoccus arenae]
MRLIDHLLDTLISRPPRVQLRAMLAIALAEWLENIAAGAIPPPLSSGKKDDEGIPSVDFFPGLEKDESLPKIVDFTVERVKKALSPGEGKLVNAVLRRIPPLLTEILQSGSLGLKTSHPDWLVRRWIAERGSEWTERELLLNQTPAEPWLCWRNPTVSPPPSWTPAPIDTLPAAIDSDSTLSSTARLPRFFRLGVAAEWYIAHQALASGQAYAQDPATWLAPALADAQSGEAILDLCAAPGGKTCHLLTALGNDPAGLLVALDQPGPRINQLDENLRAWSTDDDGPEVHLVALNLMDAQAEELGAFHAVLLDAPCSNTGVIRRRPDIKLRLRPDDITNCVELQISLLTKAAEFVADGGRLIYSTCSLEPEENAGVVEQFLEANPEWRITANAESSPADTGFDGASVFRLERG